MLSLYGQVPISNGRVSAVVEPRFGGKITELSAGKVRIRLAPAEIPEASFGLAKERLFGDNHDFIISRAEVIKKTPDTVTMKIHGAKPPFDRIELEKTISIPASGDYIRVDLTFRNLQPLAGDLAIVPWVHHSWKPAESDTFLIPHADGFSMTRTDSPVTRQISTAASGNWTGVFWEPENTGLLFLSETPPAVFYDYLSKNVSSVEMLYERTASIPRTSLTYYILPSDNWQERAFSLKEQFKPQIPGDLRHSEASPLSFAEKFTEAEAKELPQFDVAYCLPEAFISPDIPLPIPLKVLKKDSAEGIVEMELPPNVAMTAYCGGFMDIVNNRMELLSHTEKEGKNIYRFRVHVRPTARWDISAMRVFLQSRAEGDAGLLVWRVFHDGKKLAEKTLPLKNIRIPKAKIPKKFTTIFGADYMLLKTYPQLTGILKHMGVNGICLYPSIYGAPLPPGSIREMLASLKKQSFLTAFMSGSAYFNPMVENRPELQTMDISGNRMPLLDFSARGDWMDSLAMNFQKWGGADGVDLVISDYEPYFSGPMAGFTPSAEEKFQRFMAEKYPAVPWIPPKAIAGNPGKYPEQEKRWVEFKCIQFADFLKTIARKVNQLNPELKIGLCTIPGASEEGMMAANLCDQREFCRFLDFNMPMLYNNVYKTMPEYRTAIELFKQIAAASGGKAKIFPTLSTGLWGDSNPIQPPDSTFHLLLETALAQLPGCYIFPGFAGADALPLAQMSRAIDLIAANEDIIFDGTPADDAVWLSDIENTELKLPAFFKPRVTVKGSKALVYLAEYSPYPIRFQAGFQLPGRFSAKDLISGKSYGTLANGSSLDLVLSPGAKAVLLELSALDGVSFPADFAPAKQPEPEKKETSRENLVLYESFDGTTGGRPATAKHSFSFSQNGWKNHCLYFKDYQAVWTRDVNTRLSSGNATAEFHFCPHRNIVDGIKINYSLLVLNFNDHQLLRLKFETGTKGRLSIAVGVQEQDRIRWQNVSLGQTDRWAEGKWYKLKVSIGNKGLQIWIDDKSEFELKNLYDISQLNSISLGGEWSSFGRFDELAIFDRSDIE